MLADQEAAFADRDLVRGALFEDAVGSLGVPGGRFAAVLIGKDGGVKDRFDQPVEPADLHARIDAMPMHRRELREREG